MEVSPPTDEASTARPKTPGAHGVRRSLGGDRGMPVLSKPLQEEWIARFGPATGARVLLAFGAVIDFLAGRVRRAPERVAEAGAEWAWRLMLEPRRLGRRYLIQGPPALLQLKRRARVVEAATAPVPRDGARTGQVRQPGTRMPT